MEDGEARALIEGLLFISGSPLTVNDIRKIIEVDKYNTERLIREVVNEYAMRNGGLLIAEVAEGFQMVTNPACSPWIRKLLSTSVPKKLTQSSLETLAIVAYKQPIIKAEIEAIRGVSSDGVIKTLLERRLIKILGRKEVPGRPLMYGTTSEFLQYFGLKDLAELPTLKEFDEVDIPEAGEALPDEIKEHDSPGGGERGTVENAEPAGETTAAGNENTRQNEGTQQEIDEPRQKEEDDDQQHPEHEIKYREGQA